MKTIRIDRIELDLRGVPRETAEAAARLLGPALARALAAQAHGIDRWAQPSAIDAGRVAFDAVPGAGALADRLSGHIAALLADGHGRGSGS